MPSGEMKLADLDGEEVGIANVDGAIFAFGNECTHRASAFPSLSASLPRDDRILLRLHS